MLLAGVLALLAAVSPAVAVLRKSSFDRVRSDKACFNLAYKGGCKVDCILQGASSFLDYEVMSLGNVLCTGALSLEEL